MFTENYHKCERKTLPSEQGINRITWPQNKGCALFYSSFLTISIPFVLANGIGNPLCINLAEFAAIPEKLIKISQGVLFIINCVFFPVFFVSKIQTYTKIQT